MDGVWQGAPAAALCIWQDAQGVHAEPNAAALRWAERHAVSSADWLALAASHGQSGAGPTGAVAIGPRALPAACTAVPLGDGRVLLWLQPQSEDEGSGAVQRATQFLDRALVLAGVSVWRIDLRTQRVHFNTVGFHTVGVDQDPAGIPVEAMRETIHPDDREAVRRAAEEAMHSDRVIDVVARYRNRDGSWRTLLTRRVADRDEQGQVVGLAGVSLNLDAERAERERAEALAERTRLVAETMGVGFWSRDIDAGTAYWDEQMYRIHRRDPSAGPPGFDDWIELCVHPQDRAWMAELHRRASTSWAPVVDAMFRVPDEQGGQRWVQTWTRRLVRDGRRLAFGMHLDVTDRQRAEALLQRERARTQYAIEAAEVGVWERGLDSRVVYWNETMYRLRGLDPADPRPLEVLAVDCVHPDDVTVLERLVQRHLSEGVPYRLEFRVPGRDGGWRWLVTQGRSLRDADGRLLGMAGVNLDITERKNADALREQKERAEQSSRDKSTFLARVSHELRTPMNAVLGFTHLIEDDAAEPPTQRQRVRLQRIGEAGTQMMALVDDLLDLASLEAGPPPATPERVRVADIAMQVLNALSGLAEQHGVLLRTVALAEAGAVRTDRRRLGQALMHVVSHAIRQHRRGGWVEVGGRIESGAAAPLAVLSVRDDGPGYDEAERQTMFEPFLRHGAAMRSGEGSAIGLALALRLVQALGGKIEVDSRPGVGTEFRLCLPAAADADAAPASPLAVTALLRDRPLQVLCVEDNPVNLMLVRELLALRPGVRLQAAADGMSGIGMALAERPDVLLLDLQLPDIDGIEVLRRLRSEPAMAGCTYVALSANAMPDHIAAARAAGFDDYWTKPIDFERFLAGIDRLAAGRR